MKSITKPPSRSPGELAAHGTIYALAEAFSLKPETIYMLTDGNATESQAGGGLKPIPSQEIYRVAEEGQKELTKKAHLHVIYYLNAKRNPTRSTCCVGSRVAIAANFRRSKPKGRKK